MGDGGMSASLRLSVLLAVCLLLATGLSLFAGGGNIGLHSLSGLLAGNETSRVIVTALLAMVVCHLAGIVLGLVIERVVERPINN